MACPPPPPPKKKKKKKRRRRKKKKKKKLVSGACRDIVICTITYTPRPCFQSQSLRWPPLMNIPWEWFMGELKLLAFCPSRLKPHGKGKLAGGAPMMMYTTKQEKNEKGQRNGQSTKLSVFPQMIQFCFYILPHKRMLAGMSYATQLCFWSLPHKRTLAGTMYMTQFCFWSLPHKRTLAGTMYTIWFSSLPHKRTLAWMTYMTQFWF